MESDNPKHNPDNWEKIDAYTEKEEKVQVNANQFMVRKVKQPVEAYKYKL